MMTSARFSVAWVRNGARYILSHSTARPCIEAAKVFHDSGLVSDIEVMNIDTGDKVEWKT